MDYAIETIDLVKKYPTSARRDRGGPGGPGGHFGGGGRGGINSFGSIIRTLRGIKGPFIEALRGINLKIKKGEIFGVLGPNGAGKTTLIKILCTLVIHDEGEAYVYDFNVKKEPSKVLRNLQAVLPESRGFSWRLTGRQNLEFYALLYGLKKKQIEERVNYLMEFTGLIERADDGYQRYSTGMQRKLLLCRALLQDTPIIVFDEPTAGLDPNSALDFRNMLQRIVRGEGKTIFLSTHNLYEAQGVCDRIAILDRGKVTACDTPDNIRFKMFEETAFLITLIDTVFNDKQSEMVNELEKMQGVHGVTPEVDPEGNFDGISIRANKDMDISGLLEVIIKSGLKIRTINTNEPTLEDAFMAITGHQKEVEGEFRNKIRGS